MGARQLLAPWLVPEFTLGQLVFALGTAAYVFAATPFEDSDLSRDIGADYDAYRARVPTFVPLLKATMLRWLR